jgi:hypothetical protein
LVQSRALVGLEAAAVTVEVHLANGLPNFMLVGLADTEVKEEALALKNKFVDAIESEARRKADFPTQRTPQIRRVRDAREGCPAENLINSYDCGVRPRYTEEWRSRRTR